MRSDRQETKLQEIIRELASEEYATLDVVGPKLPINLLVEVGVRWNGERFVPAARVHEYVIVDEPNHEAWETWVLKRTALMEEGGERR